MPVLFYRCEALKSVFYLKKNRDIGENMAEVRKKQKEEKYNIDNMKKEKNTKIYQR